MRTLKDRFWAKVDKTGHDDCWKWEAGKVRGGYGVIRVNGIMKIAHRVSWEMENGAIPEGMIVCHHCDNPGCVNHHHLFIGTTADNMADKAAKGRCADRRGQKHPMVKLTEEKALLIRRFCNLPRYTQRVIAKMFGVSQGAIWLIKSGKTWGHI